MHNRAEYHADRSNHWRDITIFGFLEYRLPPSWFLNFNFVTVLMVKRVEQRHRANFHRNR